MSFQNINHNELEELIIAHAANNMELNVHLEGPPGIGKTQMLKGINTKIKETTGEDYEIIAVSLGTLDANETRGYPTIITDSKGTQFTQHIPLKKLIKEKDGKVVWIFDEINLARQGTIDAIMNVLHEREDDQAVINMKGDIIITISNRAFDGVSFNNRLPPTFYDRFKVYNMEMTTDVVRHWIEKYCAANYNMELVGFLRNNIELCYIYDKEKRNEKQATFRGWGEVNKILESKLPEHLKKLTIKGAIKTEAALKLSEYLDLKDKIDLEQFAKLVSETNPAMPHIDPELAEEYGVGFKHLINGILINQLKLITDIKQKEQGFKNAFRWHLYQIDEHKWTSEILARFLCDTLPNSDIMPAELNRKFQNDKDFISTITKRGLGEQLKIFQSLK